MSAQRITINGIEIDVIDVRWTPTHVIMSRQVRDSIAASELLARQAVRSHDRSLLVMHDDATLIAAHAYEDRKQRRRERMARKRRRGWA